MDQVAQLAALVHMQHGSLQFSAFLILVINGIH
jgi:hypothetical protein